jgi:hypothetical protein
MLVKKFEQLFKYKFYCFLECMIKLFIKKPRTSEQAYEAAVPIARDIFYRVFKAPKYEARDTQVRGCYRASLKSQMDGPQVDLDVWYVPGDWPRISVVSTFLEMQDDVRRLADEIERRKIGHIAWECNFPRHGPARAASLKTRLSKFLGMLK